MASRCIAWVVVWLGCHSAMAFREKAAERSAALGIECPSEVEEDGKQQCINVQTDQVVPAECCDTLHACQAELQGFQSAYMSRLVAFREGCALEPDDLRALSEGDGEGFDKDKACEPACQDSLAALPALPDYLAFNQRCSQSLALSDVRKLEAVEAQVAIVERFQDFANACLGEDDDISGQEQDQARAPVAKPQPKPLLIRSKITKTEIKVTWQLWSHCQLLPDRLRMVNPVCPSGFVQVARKRCSSFLPSVLSTTLLRQTRVQCRRIEVHRRLTVRRSFAGAAA
jgi:hypothetical protein